MATRASFPHPHPNPRCPALAVGPASSASCSSLAAAVSARRSPGARRPYPPQHSPRSRISLGSAPAHLPSCRARGGGPLTSLRPELPAKKEPRRRTTGGSYYVRVLSTVARELLKPSASVALQRHSHALVDVLPPEADSSISQFGSAEKPNVTCNPFSMNCK